MYVLYLLFASCCASVLAEPRLLKYLFGESEESLEDELYDFIEDIEEAVEVVEYAIEDAVEEFLKFINAYNKEYKSKQEEAERLEIFKDNLIRVNRMNNESANRGFGITKFMDYTPEEFKKYFTGFPSQEPKDRTMNRQLFGPTYYSPGNCPVLKEDSYRHDNVPNYWDWRQHGIVTEVKNQGTCSSCYAFVTAAILESQHARKNGELVNLAPQQIVDCDYENNGCGRGYISLAMRGLMNRGGLMKEEDYPYIGLDPRQSNIGCHYDRNKVRVYPTQCYNFELSSQEALKDLVYMQGPLGVAIKSTDLQFHRRGMIANECTGTIDHVALLVGYGYLYGYPVWLVKNSWGKDWADDGYFYISRMEGSTSCGIRQFYAASAEVAALSVYS